MRYNYGSAIASPRDVAPSFIRGIWPVKETLFPSQTLSEIPDAENQIDPRLILKSLPLSPFPVEASATAVEDLMKAAVNSGFQGFVARRKGFEDEAEPHYRDALRFTLQARQHAVSERLQGGHHQILFAAVCFALNCGEVVEARRLINEASSVGICLGSSEAWKQLCDVSLWKDAWLIAAIRHQEPDTEALNVLGERYWNILVRRCEFLAPNREQAVDLAHDAWCRVLPNRSRLKPGGNFPAYLTTIATNLWRDAYRQSQRAGCLADNQLYSLDLTLTDIHGGQTEPLIDQLSDSNSRSPAEQSLLIMDLERGLETLTPRLREVLLARFIQGESCAEIAERYACTEQTISSWVRRGLQNMKHFLQSDIYADNLQSNER